MLQWILVPINLCVCVQFLGKLTGMLSLCQKIWTFVRLATYILKFPTESLLDFTFPPTVSGGGLFRCTLIVPLLLTVLRQTYHKHSLKFFLFVEWNMYHFHTAIMSIIWSNIVIDRNPLPFPLRFEDLIYFNGFTHHPFHFADDTQVSHWNSSLITTTSWISSLVCFTVTWNRKTQALRQFFIPALFSLCK